VQNGTAGAVQLAEPYVDTDVLIIFVDTLFDADLSLVKRLPEDVAGVIWAKEVEDYQRFGVIVTDDDGNMKRIVEKPTDPISKLANIGLYYIRDWQLLFEGIRATMAGPGGKSGEYYLTDAFQYMIDHGALEDCEIGPNVTLSAGVTVRGSHHRVLRLHDSLIGREVRLRGVHGQVDAGDHTQVTVE
jgi:dTDP-glucose pyrophosphorylase